MLLSFFDGLTAVIYDKSQQPQRDCWLCVQYEFGSETKKVSFTQWVNDTVKTLITVFGTRPNSDTNTVIISDCFAIVNLFAKERGKWEIYKSKSLATSSTVSRTMWNSNSRIYLFSAT